MHINEKLYNVFHKVNAIYIISFIFISIGTFIFLDNIGFFNSEEEKNSKTINEVQVKKESVISFKLLKNLGKDVSVGDFTKFTFLFSKFDIKKVSNSRYYSVYKKGIKKYLTVYEIKGGLETYINLKNGISNTFDKKSKSSVYEANNLGYFSFYLNDFEKKEKVFLVSLIKGNIIAFEYSKKNHETIKRAVTRSLKQIN